MTDTTQNFAAESWAFALQLDAEPDVAESCLKLRQKPVWS
jgi:hypothetical protein